MICYNSSSFYDIEIEYTVVCVFTYFLILFDLSCGFILIYVFT